MLKFTIDALNQTNASQGFLKPLSKLITTFFEKADPTELAKVQNAHFNYVVKEMFSKYIATNSPPPPEMKNFS